MQAPVRVCAVKVAVGRDHFRLKPYSERHSVLFQHIVDCFDSSGELSLVDDPVAERAVIAVALAEPAVIDDEKLYTELCGAFGNLYKTFLVEAEIAGFPAVQQNAVSPDVEWQSMASGVSNFSPFSSFHEKPSGFMPIRTRVQPN